jgi:exo-1,4-beta-D-glucosaminidase
MRSPREGYLFRFYFCLDLNIATSHWGTFMTKSSSILLVLFVVVAAGGRTANAQSESGRSPKQILRTGWSIQSSAQVAEKPEAISTAGFTVKGWHPASVPSTVLATLVEDKVYPDPYFGLNLKLIPGSMLGEDFIFLPMPPESPFRVPWWYRTEFQAPAGYQGKQVWLNFEGINYRANIWINGRRIADSQAVAGAFRVYEFNITDNIKPGAMNALALEVFPEQPDDLGINWMNLGPDPPDKDMGIWQNVYITTSGPVTLRNAQVVSHLDAPSLQSAQLTVSVDVRNAGAQPVKGVLKGQIGNIQLQQPVELGPAESKRVAFTPEQFAQLKISHPRVWWPWQMGAQELYELKLQFESAGQVSDQDSVQFGIREVTSELNEHGDRLFKINGKNLLIRGALWWPDLMLRSSPARQEAELGYVRDMNLNTLRMDGRFEDEQFYNRTDRMGLLLMPGWPCCEHWEKWKNWKTEDYKVAPEMLRDRIRRLRNHPSVFTWLNGDDNPPAPEVEKAYIKVLEEENWPNPYQSHSGRKRSAVTGVAGYKHGPDNYDPPNYWLLDHKQGGAWGFDTETYPGPTIPPIESLREFIPADKLWPINEYWTVHGDGSTERHELQVHSAALNARYGPATGVEDFAEKSQVMNYEGERAMYEGYSRNKYVATGILQHDLNNPWPSLVFHLYDSYLRPGGGYFGAKKGCEPVHIQYSYDDQSIVVVNSTYKSLKNLKAKVEVYNLDLKQKFAKEATVDVPEDGVSKVATIPELPGLTATYFVRLTLHDAAGREISSNLYWLSTKQDVLDWEHASQGKGAPTLSYSDLTGLQTLPPVQLKGKSRTQRKGDENLTTVTLENPTKNLAFFVHLRINKGSSGREVLPIIWEDNYFSLMPGEKKEVTATFRREDSQGATPVVQVDGWNVTKASL